MPRNRMKSLLCMLFCLAMVFRFGQAAAQDEGGILLDLSRTFGYSSGTGQIQGVFTLKAKGPENLARVMFLMDGQPIGEATSQPFNLRFSTGDYSLGRHVMSAAGYTSSGSELASNEQIREFVPASAAVDTIKKIIVPLFVAIGLAVALSYGIPLPFGRGKITTLPPGAQRSYTPLGGAICPKCSRPFAVHLYGFNVIIGKYDRCPYCGKWSLVRRASHTELEAAEQAELAFDSSSSGLAIEHDSDSQLKQDLENSRFEDL